MFNLNNLNGCEIIALANIISISISQNLSAEELAILSGFFTIIGDSLATLAISPINNINNENNNLNNKNC